MPDNYLKTLKENRKEWQIKEEASVHRGNIYDLFNQYVDEDNEDDTSESVNDGQALPAESHPQLPPHKPSQNANHQKQLVRQARKPITFAPKKDNAARIAFRNNKQFDKQYNIGRALKDIESNLARIHRNFEEIGVRCGSFILPQRSIDESSVLIWGSPKQVAATITELKLWQHRAIARASIGKAHTLSDREAFAKVHSPLGPNYALEQQIAKRNGTRQHYQKVPVPGSQFPFNGYFLWPNDEVRAVDLFGPHCEALDPLRLEFKVRIVLEEARSVLKIYSNASTESICEVTERIENTVKEYRARNHRPITLFFVEPRTKFDYGSDVAIKPGPLIGQTKIQSKIPVSCGDQDPPSDKNWELETQNDTRIYNAVSTVVERIPYHRGHLQIRVLFGTFALVKFQWPPGAPSVAVEEFSADIESPGTKGTIIRNLQFQRDAHDIVTKCHKATGLFQIPGSHDGSLADVVPQYTAMFYLPHPEKTKEIVQLAINFKPTTTDAEQFEASKALWIKGGKSDAFAQAPPLEVFNVRLHTGVSWELKVSADNPVDSSRITPSMEDFANGVKFNKPPTGEDPMIFGQRIFDMPSNLAVLGREQKTTLRYSLVGEPKFIFELSRYDEYDGPDVWRPSSTQWAASLYDREWDSRLFENAKLGIGQSSSWSPNLDPLFGHPGAHPGRSGETGFKDFLFHTRKVASFLDTFKDASQDTAEIYRNSKLRQYVFGSEDPI
ncbi:MAG: hypothetical protein Q9222_001058 [Ikaeria aurantiellina]